MYLHTVDVVVYTWVNGAVTAGCCGRAGQGQEESSTTGTDANCSFNAAAFATGSVARGPEGGLRSGIWALFPLARWLRTNWNKEGRVESVKDDCTERTYDRCADLDREQTRFRWALKVRYFLNTLYRSCLRLTALIRSLLAHGGNFDRLRAPYRFA